MKNKSPQTAFEKLVREPHTSSSSKLLKFVAVSLWYEEFTPKVSTFKKSDELALAGYLLDKLTRYNCMSSEHKKAVRSKLSTVKTKYLSLTYKGSHKYFLHQQTSNKCTKDSTYYLVELSSHKKVERPSVKDKLAKYWCTYYDFKSEFKDLLPLQRRELNELITEVYDELQCTHYENNNVLVAYKSKTWDELSQKTIRNNFNKRSYTWLKI